MDKPKTTEQQLGFILATLQDLKKGQDLLFEKADKRREYCEECQVEADKKLASRDKEIAVLKLDIGIMKHEGCLAAQRTKTHMDWSGLVAKWGALCLMVLLIILELIRDLPIKHVPH